MKCFDDIDQLVWEKLICNVCYSGTCSVTERTILEVMQDPDTRIVASGCAAEAYNVARARHPAGFRRSSGLRARLWRKNPERAGVAAPYNEVIGALLRAKERRMGVRA